MQMRHSKKLLNSVSLSAVLTADSLLLTTLAAGRPALAELHGVAEDGHSQGTNSDYFTIVYTLIKSKGRFILTRSTEHEARNTEHAARSTQHAARSTDLF